MFVVFFFAENPFPGTLSCWWFFYFVSFSAANLFISNVLYCFFVVFVFVFFAASLCIRNVT